MDAFSSVVKSVAFSLAQRSNPILYEELSGPNFFRLMQLSIKDGYGMLRCHLKIIDLAAAPDFFALSYCWGHDTNKVTILCNGQRCQISSNLAAALDVIRHSTYKEKWMWIDQICINQNNQSECKHQVQLMKGIYQRAVRTLIWLGPDDGTAGLAFRLIRQIYLTFLREEAAAGGSKSMALQREIVTAENNQRRGLPAFDSIEWEHLALVLYRPWFIRVWIIQEVVLSQEDPLVLCGHCSVTWEYFGLAITWLHRKGYGVWQRPRLPLRRNLTLVTMTRRKSPWKIEALLQHTRRFRATDPRDMIFGLLGLAAETQDLNYWPPALVPDYGKSITEVYRDVARFIISESKKLTILSAIDHLTSPTWVPHWNLIRTRSYRCISSISYSKDNEEGYFETQDNINNASRGLPLRLEEDQDLNVLLLQGLWVDRIEICTKTMAFSDRFDDPDTGRLRTTIPELWQFVRQRYSDDGLTARAFFTTTVAGRVTWEDETLPAAMEPLSHFWAFMLENRQLLHRTLNRSVPALQERAAGGDAKRYASNLQVCNQRRFFLTSQGYMGIGPPTTNVGDIISVLFGSQVPFVLCPVEDQYEFRGEAYVYGVMNGEAVDAWEAGKLSVQWFRIR